MTTAQRIVIIIWCIALVFVCIFVPWGVDSRTFGYQTQGYHLLWSPPSSGSVDLSRLVLEIIGVTVLGVACLVFAGFFKKQKKNS